MTKSVKKSEIERDITVDGPILDMITKLVDKQHHRLSNWEKGFLLSLLDYTDISQKQLNSLYSIVWRIEGKQPTFPVPEPSQPDLSDVPFDPPYIIRKRR